MEKGLTALGEGKLNYKPEVVFKGDFIALGNAMEKITGLLRDSLQQIGSSAELVSGGAEQVSNGAQALARGAAEQASSVEELAVSINEIADSVRDNADNAVLGNGSVNPGEDSLLLAVSCGKYQLGILFTGDPYILPAGTAETVESPADMGDSGIWAGKEICRHEKEILFVIDMEKTVEGLIICQ